VKKILYIAVILLFFVGMSSCTKDDLVEPDNNHCEPDPTSLNAPQLNPSQFTSGSLSDENGEAIHGSPDIGDEINDDGDEEDEDRNPKDAE
jgi:hypothetical protein